jgi:hypothetical protein
MTIVRIALKREVAMADVGYVAYDQEWRIVSVTRKGESPQKQVWDTLRGNTVVTFLEDPHLGLRYLTVEGEDVPAVSSVLNSSLAAWSSEECLRYLENAQNRDEKIYGLYLIAASAPQEVHEATVNLLRQFTLDEESDVRRALLVALGYLGSWASTRAMAESIYDSDPDGTVRRDAGYLLEGLSLLPRPGS